MCTLISGLADVWKPVAIHFDLLSWLVPSHFSTTHIVCMLTPTLIQGFQTRETKLQSTLISKVYKGTWPTRNAS
jgi:hypothetical protein